MERDVGKGDKDNNAPSPSESQQTISDDDVIDYSIKPEFYDSDLDGKDELWVQKKRKGHHTDAVLSCPCCFTTLCLECQRHEKYVTQYRAVFVVNCKIKSGQVLQQSSLQPKRGKRRRESNESETNPVSGETFRQVCCSVCLTEVGAFDEDEIYHFFNVLPRKSLCVFGLGFNCNGKGSLVACCAKEGALHALVFSAMYPMSRNKGSFLNCNWYFWIQNLKARLKAPHLNGGVMLTSL